MKRSLAVLALLLLALEAGHADTYIVPLHYPRIQDALDAATNDDVILVLPGTYLENVDFLGKAVTLRSDMDGLPQTIDIAPESTVIDGGMAGSVVKFVGNEGSGSVLEGFKLINGNGTPKGNITLGGGIAMAGSSPVISRNIITGNWANGGGGISCMDGACPRIQDNIVTFNESKGSGGGIRCYAQCDAVITNNLVQGNRAGSKGAGFFITYSSPTVMDNVVKDNVAYTGAGLFCGWPNGDKTALLAGNVIINNIATKGVAGGLGIDASILRAENNILAGNEAVNGGGIYCAWNQPLLVNCTIVDNKAKNQGGGIFCLSSKPTIRNSILRDNQAPTGPQIHNMMGAPQITYSNVKGGYVGVGNIDADPMFVDPAIGDFHILHGSPCRDSGDPSGADLPPEDFEGDPRVVNDRVDMGADEFHIHLYYTGEASPGGSVSIKILGNPDSTPLLLWVGSGILEVPLSTKHGTWYLHLPLVFEAVLGKVSPEGLAEISYHFSPDFPAPFEIAMQALVGEDLTNPCLMFVK